MDVSRPEHWSGRPFSSPGGLPKPGIESRSPALQADSSPAEPQGKPHKQLQILIKYFSLSIQMIFFFSFIPSTWLRCIIHFIYHQVRQANVLFGVFASMLVRKVGIQFSFLTTCLSGWGENLH